MATTQKKTTNVLAALAEARAIISNTKMKKGGRNSYSNYDYFTPDQVHKLVEDACQKTGLVTTFQLRKDELGYYGELSLYGIESNDERSFEFRTDVPEIKATNASQKLGGMMTYTERYAKMSVFGIVDNNLDFDSQDNRAKEKPKTTNTKPESSKEEQFVAYIKKQGGLTDALKAQLKKAPWDATKLKELVKQSGVKTIKDSDVDAVLG